MSNYTVSRLYPVSRLYTVSRLYPVSRLLLYSALSMSLFGGEPTELQRDIMLDIIQNIEDRAVVSYANTVQNTTTREERRAAIGPLMYDIQRRINEIAELQPLPQPQTPPQLQTPPQPQTPRTPQIHRRITQPTYKEKSTALCKKQAEIQEECAICQETHAKTTTTVLETCNHSFGTQCIQQWMDICWTRDNKRATCPSCRVEIYKITKYRPRATRQVKQVEQVV